MKFSRHYDRFIFLSFMLYPDLLVEKDNYNTMINGLGVTGWGVGGTVSEVVMLNQ